MIKVGTFSSIMALPVIPQLKAVSDQIWESHATKPGDASKNSIKKQQEVEEQDEAR